MHFVVHCFLHFGLNTSLLFYLSTIFIFVFISEKLSLGSVSSIKAFILDAYCNKSVLSVQNLAVGPAKDFCAG